jgi:hypothetical protein
VQENKAAAAAASRPVKAESRSDGGTAYLQKSEYGQVPAYLLQRKMELAQQEEAMQAAKHAAQIPAGAEHSELCCPVSVTCICILSGLNQPDVSVNPASYKMCCAPSVLATSA